VVQDFQDAYTLNVRQLMKCCVEEITPDGRLIPACAYNSVGYREQVREQLSGVPVAPVAPNAQPLQPLLDRRPTAPAPPPGGTAPRGGATPLTLAGSSRRLDPDGRPREGLLRKRLLERGGALAVGERFDPGGAALTSRLARALRVGPGSAVVDVACGVGASTIQMVRETGADALGVDLSAELLAKARSAAVAAELDGPVRFLEGDAEALPLDTGSADAVLCECALCTFPDKRRAAGEMARVLRPGRRLGLADMVPSRNVSRRSW